MREDEWAPCASDTKITALYRQFDAIKVLQRYGQAMVQLQPKLDSDLERVAMALCSTAPQSRLDLAAQTIVMHERSLMEVPESELDRCRELLTAHIIRRRQVADALVMPVDDIWKQLLQQVVLA